MKRLTWMVVGIALVASLLVGGAFMIGRFLGTDLDGLASSGGKTVTVSTADGQVVKAEWVSSPDLPEDQPDVVGTFSHQEDNRIFVNETEGGFVLSKGEDDEISVSNTTGKIAEIVVTNETEILVDQTGFDTVEAIIDGKLYQQVAPGTLEGLGALSFVRAWGDMHGDRLVASVLCYMPPPVISR